MSFVPLPTRLRNWRRSFLLASSFFLLLLWSVNGLVMPAYAATTAPVQEITTVDDVTLTIQGSYLPQVAFESTKAGDAIQRTVALRNSPYSSFAITAVPYGTSPGEGLPAAKAGSAAQYRKQLRTAWKHQNKPIQSVSAISIFGHKIVGTQYETQMPLNSLAVKQTTILEWITEAGGRVWLVRWLQEANSSGVSVAQQVQDLTITSATLSNPTTLQSQKAPTHKASPTITRSPLVTYPYPAFWNGTLCDTANHPTAYQLGSASLNGVLACGPRPAYDSDPYGDHLVYYFSGAWGQLEFECVELSMRYMYLAYNINPYPANGNEVVPNYSGSTLQKISSSNNTIGSNIGAGDILSWNTGSSAGHTSVVSAVNLNESGNGTLTTIEQNGSANGTFTYPVSGWVLNTEGYGSLIGWLHAPTTPTPNPGGNTSAVKASPVDVTYTDGTQDVFAVGSDGRMWHNWADASGKWIGWNWWSNNTDFAAATPTLVRYSDGSMDLIAVGKDGRLWHNWASGKDDWIGWNWWSNNTDFAAVAPTLVKYNGGSMDLIAVGKDGRLWHDWASGKDDWIGWNWWSNNTDFAAVPSTLVTYNSGALDLIAVGKDGRLWHNWASGKDDWVGWNWWSNNTDFANSASTLVKYSDGSMDLIAVGKDGRMWHNWASASGSWIGWNWWSTSTPFANAAPTLVRYNDGSIDLIAVGKDGRMWHNWAGGKDDWIGWNWWSNNTPFTNASPTLVKYSSGAIDLLAIGTDGRMWHNWASGKDDWIGWNWWSNNTPFAN